MVNQRFGRVPSYGGDSFYATSADWEHGPARHVRNAVRERVAAQQEPLVTTVELSTDAPWFKLTVPCSHTRDVLVAVVIAALGLKAIECAFAPRRPPS